MKVSVYLSGVCEHDNFRQNNQIVLKFGTFLEGPKRKDELVNRPYATKSVKIRAFFVFFNFFFQIKNCNIGFLIMLITFEHESSDIFELDINRFTRFLEDQNLLSIQECYSLSVMDMFSTRSSGRFSARFFIMLST